LFIQENVFSLGIINVPGKTDKFFPEQLFFPKQNISFEKNKVQ